MTKFNVEIIETLSRVVETEARSADEAVEIVGQRYRDCDIVLDASDYNETIISVSICNLLCTNLFCLKR